MAMGQNFSSKKGTAINKFAAQTSRKTFSYGRFTNVVILPVPSSTH